MRRWNCQRASQTQVIVIFSIIVCGAATGCTPDLEPSMGESFGAIAASQLQQWAVFGVDMLRALFAAFVL